MLSTSVLKHYYKIEKSTISNPSMEIISQSTWDRLGVTKKYWQSLTNAQRIQLNVEYYDRLDGVAS